MNINTLFPTTGTTGSNGSMQLTNSIQNIPITTEAFPDSYYLGYMRHWFAWQKTTQATYNPETDEISFNDITDYTAYPSIGYGAHIYSTAMFYITNYFYDSNSGKFVCSTGTDKYLLNNFHPQATSMRNLALEFVLLGIDNDSYAPRSYVTFTSISDFLDFYNGNRSIVLSDTYYSRTYTIYRNDLTKDGYFDTPDNTRFVLKQGFFDSDSYYDDNNTPYTGYRPQIFVQSNYLVLGVSVSSVTFGENNSIDWGTIGLNIYNNNPYLYQCLPKNQTEDGNIVISVPFIGHLDGKFNASDWFRTDRVGQWDIIDSDGEGRTYIFSERNAAQYPVGVLWQSTIEDVYKNASLYRWTTSNVYGFSDGVSYYPTFNPNDMNEFTLGLQTGTQTELQQLLPLWYRLDNAQASTYTDTDKPTPEQPEIAVDNAPIETGSNIPDFTSIRRVSGNAFNAMYEIPLVGIEEMGYLLSQSANTFWHALGTATDDKQSNILDYVVSLKWYPCDFDDGVSQNFIQFGYNGNAQLTFSSGVTIHKINFCYQHFDMGSVFVPSYFDTICFLDYEPYTTCKLYMPYIGFVDVPANLVINHTINFNYIVDLTTGIATCFADNGHNIIYTGSGQIGVDIAVSGNDILTQSQQTVSAYLSGASKLANGVVGLGIAGLSGNAVAGIGAVGGIMSDIATTAIDIASAKRGKPVSVSGGSGFGASFNPQTPCIFVERSCIKIPSGYGHSVGFVSNAKSKIENLTGYTQIENPDLSEIPGINQNEMTILSDILKSGFYA